MKVSPDQALMIGDSASDILAAHQAGVRSIGVGWATKGAAQLQSAKATYMISRMDELMALIPKIV